MRTNSNSVLIVVDLQNDFLPGGSSPVPGGELVPQLANQLQGAFKLVVATQDWHPANHKSFAANHASRKPGEVIQLKKMPQILWPVHCVQNTRGAELTSALRLNKVNKVIRKGTDADIDGYSAFFDNGHVLATGLSDYLRDKRVKNIYVMGLGLEYCVKATALDAIGLGFQTFLLEDACRGINLKPGDAQGAMEQMAELGVTVIQSRDLLSLPS
jgi:nicotinamidase/pyrazinamidase